MEIIVLVGAFLVFLYWLGTLLDNKEAVEKGYSETNISDDQIAKFAFQLAMQGYEQDVKTIKSVAGDCFEEIQKNTVAFNIITIAYNLAQITVSLEKKKPLSVDYYKEIKNLTNEMIDNDGVKYFLNGAPESLFNTIDRFCISLQAELPSQTASDEYLEMLSGAYSFSENELVDLLVLSSLFRQAQLDFEVLHGQAIDSFLIHPS